LTFAPPVAPGATTRDGGPLRDTATVTDAPRGGSIRDRAPVRGQHGVASAEWPRPAAEVIDTTPPRPEYHLPPLALLEDIAPRSGDSTMDHQRNAAIIEAKLASFNIPARVAIWNAGPVVTQYEVGALAGHQGLPHRGSLGRPGHGPRGRARFRIEAPIPGKSVVGIEIPNKDFNIVAAAADPRGGRPPRRLEADVPRSAATWPATLRATDLAKIAALLIAGATGSGKSRHGQRADPRSLLCNATPDEVRLVLVDLKRVELSGITAFRI